MSPSEDGSHSPTTSAPEEDPNTIANDSNSHEDGNGNESPPVDQPQDREEDSQPREETDAPPPEAVPDPAPEPSEDVSSLFSDSTAASGDQDTASTTKATIVKEGTKDLSSMFGGSDQQESPFGSSTPPAPAPPAPTTIVKEGNVDNLGGLFGATDAEFPSPFAATAPPAPATVVKSVDDAGVPSGLFGDSDASFFGQLSQPKTSPVHVPPPSGSTAPVPMGTWGPAAQQSAQQQQQQQPVDNGAAFFDQAAQQSAQASAGYPHDHHGQQGAWAGESMQDIDLNSPGTGSDNVHHDGSYPQAAQHAYQYHQSHPTEQYQYSDPHAQPTHVAHHSTGELPHYHQSQYQDTQYTPARHQSDTNIHVQQPYAGYQQHSYQGPSYDQHNNNQQQTPYAQSYPASPAHNAAAGASNGTYDYPVYQVGLQGSQQYSQQQQQQQPQQLPQQYQPSAQNYNDPGPSTSFAVAGFDQSDRRYLERGDQHYRPFYPKVCFGFGGRIVTVIPRAVRSLNYMSPDPQAQGSQGQLREGALVVQNVKDLCSSDPAIRSIAAFPGPLASANKGDVSDFLEAKVSGSLPSDSGIGRNPTDARMLWKLMDVMVRYYGKLQASADDSGDTPDNEIRRILTSESDGSFVQHHGQNLQSGGMATAGSSEQSQTEILRALLAGHREDAVRAALRHQDWAHALLLSSQINPELYRSVVQQFADANFPPGSPMRTLYYMFANKAVDLFPTNDSGQTDSTELLENWQNNVAMIMANRTQNDAAVLTQIGDMLWLQRGRVEAAHLCYLIANHPLVEHAQQDTRLILIGGDHRTGVRKHFLTLDSLQRTELFEYAKTLGNPQFTLPQFQSYKLRYAMIIADLGYPLEAHRYVQRIQAVQQGCRKTYPFHPAFVDELNQFRARLSHHLGDAAESGGKGWFSGIARVFDSMITGPDAQFKAPSKKSKGHNRTNSTASDKGDKIDDASSQAASDVASSKAGSKAGDKALGKRESRLGSWVKGAVSGLINRGEKQANLGEGNQFYYNETHKCWLPVGKDAPDPVEKPPPPPSSPAMSTGSNASAGGPGMGPGGPPRQQFSMRASRGGGARSRYVDTLGGSKSSTTPQNTPTSSGTRKPPRPPQFAVFTPQAPVAQPAAANESEPIPSAPPQDIAQAPPLAGTDGPPSS